MRQFNYFGKDALLDHVGVAVQSIRKIAGKSTITVDKRQRVKVAFVRVHGLTVELVEPLTARSPVTRRLRQGQRIYHICYRVKSLEKALRTSKRFGFHCIADPVPAAAFHQRKITWVYSARLGLFELVEKTRQRKT